MTPIQYKLTVEDLKNGMQLGMLRQIRHRWWKFAIALIAISAAIPLIISYWDGFNFSRWLEGFGYLLAIYTSVTIVVWLLVYFWMAGWRARKQFGQMPMLAREQTISWDREDLHFRSSNGNSDFPIGELHKFHSSEKMILLYPADHLFFILPCDIFDSLAQYDELLQLLKQSDAKWI